MVAMWIVKPSIKEGDKDQTGIYNIHLYTKNRSHDLE